jgi:hypothetical protein
MNDAVNVLEAWEAAHEPRVLAAAADAIVATQRRNLVRNFGSCINSAGW